MSKQHKRFYLSSEPFRLIFGPTIVVLKGVATSRSRSDAAFCGVWSWSTLFTQDVFVFFFRIFWVSRVLFQDIIYWRRKRYHPDKYAVTCNRNSKETTATEYDMKSPRGSMDWFFCLISYTLSLLSFMLLVRHCLLMPICNQGPVVQSVISLTCPFVVKILTVLVSTISNSQVFLLKKM